VDKHGGDSSNEVRAIPRGNSNGLKERPLQVLGLLISLDTEGQLVIRAPYERWHKKMLLSALVEQMKVDGVASMQLENLLQEINQDLLILLPPSRPSLLGNRTS
jgi:hypothetical protein